MTTPQKNAIKGKTEVLDDFDDFSVDKEEEKKIPAKQPGKRGKKIPSTGSLPYFNESTVDDTTWGKF